MKAGSPYRSGPFDFHYRENKILEAVCEVRFTFREPWDPGWVGLIASQLAPIYPEAQDFKRMAHSIQVEGRSFTHRVEESPVRCLQSPEGKDLLQVAEGALSVHRLAPYRRWEDLEPRIQGALEAAREVIPDMKPQRLGLRYINRFEIPVQAELSDYLLARPETPARPEGETFGPFFMRTELYDTESPSRLLIVQMGLAPPSSPGTFPVVLDLDRVYLDAASAWEEVAAQLQEARRRIREFFENAITDRLRKEILGGMEESDAAAQ
ncbi:MAG TPA: TIGR04255 family protein [Candidatus Nitrosotenuis sp.]|nr:TIGR04255 family protein [Candidatus Nitrosotenuis sp.]